MPTPRPLRRDAVANRERVVAAVREGVARYGFGVTVAHVAEIADCGVATIYRSFPTKAELLRAYVSDVVDEIREVDTDACAITDPRAALRELFRGIGEHMSKNRGLGDVLAGTPSLHVDLTALRTEVTPLIAGLVRRAKAAHLLRTGADVGDVAFLVGLIAHVVTSTADVDPALWRRYVSLLTAGLLADDPTPLPGEAPDVTILDTMKARAAT